MVQAIAAEHGGGDFAWAGQAEERSQLWQARHDAACAAKAARPGWGMWATDVCVPISRLAECILETQKDIVANGLYAPIVGHVGDGNFHLTMMVNPDDPTDLPRAEALNERLVARALAMDGTCTGEHGVGLGKIKFLVRGARRGDVADARHQEGARPRQHHEPGQDPGTDQLTFGCS